MAAIIEVSYFNSFWMKQVNTLNSNVVWPNGYPYNTGAQALPLLGGGNIAAFPASAVDTTINPVSGLELNWFIEESRIRGGYNNTQTDYGVKAYIVEEEPAQQHRFNSLIYSGIYNSRTGINNTNQFSVGVDITKSLDPAYGSIQKLFSEDTNMTVFQESKVSRALIDKDAVYSAEGGGSMTSSSLVIGQITPYLGEYGISRNPESFAYYGFQKYFTDRDRGVVLRLSRDGITEISSYGMIDYFRDNLPLISEDNTWIIETSLTTASNPSNSRQILVYGVNLSTTLIGMQVIVNGNFLGYIVDVAITGLSSGIVTVNRRVIVAAGDIVTFNSIAPAKIMGGYDIHNKNYILSLQQAPQYAGYTTVNPTDYSTLAFDELINGWVAFYSYKPSQIFSLRNDMYSIEYANIWKHYSNAVSVGSFYGTPNSSNITFIFNKDSSFNKVFQTVNYEGDNGWQVESFISDATGYDFATEGWEQFNDQAQSVLSYVDGRYISSGITYYSGFNRKENKYYANLINISTAQPGEVVFGQQVSGIKGRFATVKFSTDSSTDVGGNKELWAVGTKVNYIR
tara:strand:- start:1299 stop:3002 length:1704 start_codon:yes stop_codon:yes gene_type:complete